MSIKRKINTNKKTVNQKSKEIQSVKSKAKTMINHKLLYIPKLICIHLIKTILFVDEFTMIYLMAN